MRYNLLRVKWANNMLFNISSDLIWTSHFINIWENSAAQLACSPNTIFFLPCNILWDCFLCSLFSFEQISHIVKSSNEFVFVLYFSRYWKLFYCFDAFMCIEWVACDYRLYVWGSNSWRAIMDIQTHISVSMTFIADISNRISLLFISAYKLYNNMNDANM